jgi:phosphoribosylglycinamide formyltransferase 1
MTKRLVVLFGGEGSNFENIVRTLGGKEFDGIKIEIFGAVCNKPEANGIKRAQKLGIPCTVIDHKKYDSRESFDAELVKTINGFGCDLCVMAGFMRILTPVFTRQIKAVNIHPSFLPHFKGADGIKESFEGGMGYGGVSIHWVSDGVDEGEIIMQERVEILPNDTLEVFKTRVHQKEHELYPKAIIKALF